MGIKLWLDDLRPAPPGWIWVTTIDEAKKHLIAGDVEEASLDHDLGACVACMAGRTPEQWLEESHYTQMPNCTHVGTGYQLICWMEEQNIWPRNKPNVHSANPVGRMNMQVAINRRFGS